MGKKNGKLSVMGGNISRRDFLNGVAVSAVASQFRFPFSSAVAEEMAALPYPPTLTGMRGSHTGSFEVAHALAREGKRWTRPARQTDELYDLVVVGGGFSGLSGAYFYQKNLGRPCRILVLDNHDDFGGHAKRNEFHQSGEMLLSSGGSFLPTVIDPATKELLSDMRVVIEKLGPCTKFSALPTKGYGQGIYFDKETYGREHLAVSNAPLKSEFGRSLMHGWLAILKSPQADDFLEGLPLSQQSRQDLKRMVVSNVDYLEGKSPKEKMEYLKHHTYSEYLKNKVKVSDEVIAFFRPMSEVLAGVGFDTSSAREALMLGFPAFKGLGIRPPGSAKKPKKSKSEYLQSSGYFPDGNASIVRMLVRKMIPGIAPGSTMEDIVTAKFDYSQLDVAENLFRFRLNSTVVNVEHDDGQVDVTYVKNGEESARRVRAKKVLIASYHAIIPHICPTLPELQKQALAQSVKTPVIFTNVLLRNSKAWAKLSVDSLYFPQGYWHSFLLEPPVHIGEFNTVSTSIDRPIVAKLRKCPCVPQSGLNKKEQHRRGRIELLTTPFSTMEQHIRRQLTDALGPAGFDASRDILAITVNRWSHGYAYKPDPMYDAILPENERYETIGRQAFGNISIANSDSEGYPTMDAAISQGYRGAMELLA